MKRPPEANAQAVFLFYAALSVTERNSVRICVDVSAEYHYTLNESPYYAYLT